MFIDLVSLILAMVFAGYGVWTIFGEIRRFRRTRTWPTVTGQIVDSQVTDNGETYGVLVQYHYTVGGCSYKGSTNVAGVETGMKGRAEKLCELYPVGLGLPIAYDPQQVQQSEIADDAQSNLRFGVILMGLIIVAFGFLLARLVSK